MYEDFDEHDYPDDVLEHHGILGMKWGERRFQDSHGNWTEEGLARRRKGGARRIVENLSQTARNANKKLSNAARKTFRPTAEDLDEKIAKAREKQVLKDKKKELATLQGRNRRIKDMTDQEVLNEIQSRRNRMTLEEMRKESSKIHQGKEFAKAAGGTALNVVATPAKALGGIAGYALDYGLRTAARTAIDTAAYNISTNAKKKSAYKNRTDSEVLKDKLQDAKNKRDLEDTRFQETLRDVRNETARNKAEYERSSAYYKRSVLDSDEIGSSKAAERIDREKRASSGKYGDSKKKDQQRDQQKERDEMKQLFKEIAKEQAEQQEKERQEKKRRKKEQQKLNQNN